MPGGGGGGGGGGGLQQTNMNSTQTSGPNPYLAPMLQNIGNNAFDWIGKNMNAPGYFPGGTVAPQSQNTVNALGQTAAIATGSNLPQYGGDFVRDTLSGKYLDLANNPGARASLEASFRPQTEQLMTQILPGIDSKFAGSGRTASGAHFDTTMRGVNDLNRAQADATAKMYQGERANQFAALGALPQIQNMAYQNAAALAQAGAGQDAYSQRLLDDRNAQYEYDNTAQLDWYNRLSQSLQGMYPGGQTVGQQSGSQWGSGGGGGGDGGQTGQLVGAGIAAAGSIAAAFI